MVGDAPPGIRTALPQRHPALPRAGQLGRRRGRRRGGGRAAVRPRPGAGVRHVVAGHRGHGGPCRQRGGQPARRLRDGLGDRREYAKRFHAVRLDAHPGTPPGGVRRGERIVTSTTRGLLPDRVPLVDAAFTGSRTALAVLAFTRRPDLLLPATEDRLHQSYRRPAYPASAELVDALRSAGIPAVISGAGPTVLALTTDGGLPDRPGPARLRDAGPARRHRRAPGSRSDRPGAGSAARGGGGCCPRPGGTSTLGSATAIPRHPRGHSSRESQSLLSRRDPVPTRAASLATVATIAALACRGGRSSATR